MNEADDIDDRGPDGLATPGAEAAAWVVRVHGEGSTEEDWLALEAWLRSSPEHLSAFAEAEELFLEFDRRSADLLAMPEAQPDPSIPSLAAHRPSARRSRLPTVPRWAPPSAVAAGLAAAVGAAWLIQPLAPAARVYTTDVGQRREVALADGSVVDLNSDSRLIARVDRTHRRLVLEHGEAVFDVAHDHAHPFVVAVGDEDVTVVGTQFDILRYDREISVTVSRGMVQVTPSSAATTTARLGPGDQLRHREGAATSQIERVPPEDALAWRTGYVVYENRTLADITADLGRYFHVPIRAEGRAAGLTFSGALRIDNEDAVVRTLQAFLPITAVHAAGRIVLRPR